LAIYSQQQKRKKKDRKTGSRIPATLNFAHVRKKKCKKGRRAEGGKKKEKKSREEKKDTKDVQRLRWLFCAASLQSAASSEPDVLIKSTR
jgi:hypothetical protein